MLMWVIIVEFLKDLRKSNVLKLYFEISKTFLKKYDECFITFITFLSQSISHIYKPNVFITLIGQREVNQKQT